MNPSWMVTPEKINEAVKTLVREGKPRRVILFGSAATGKLHMNSDADFLVVTGADVPSPRKESVRLRRALRGLSMAMDILVVSEARLKSLADVPGLIYREALKTGRVVYEAAG